jgi:hypothetical protein
LFGFGKTLKNEFNVSNDDKVYLVIKRKYELQIQQSCKDKEWFVPWIKFSPVLDDIESSVMETRKRETIDIII